MVAIYVVALYTPLTLGVFKQINMTHQEISVHIKFIEMFT
jgi:hypothetical protein